MSYSDTWYNIEEIAPSYDASFWHQVDFDQKFMLI